MSRTALFILLIALFPLQLLAHEKSEPEAFKVDEYIMEHILDSYGWHITDIKGNEITIPLPIILFDHGKIVCFMSSEFHHGTAAYKGYALGFTEDAQGKIVKLQGENADFTGTLEYAKQYAWDTVFFNISISKNVCAILISILILCGVFLSVAKTYRRNPNRAPKGMQNMMEAVILFIRDEVAIPMIGKDKYQKYFPYLLTLFFFILMNNLLGLIPIFPGGANVTGNIAVTLTLALITFFVVQFSSTKTYWKHIVNTPGVPIWLKLPIPIMPVIELFGLITKPFVLMIRLFANIMAGHIVVLGFLALIFIFGAITPYLGIAVSPVSVFFYIFMGLLELLVAFIQSYIFTILTALYIGMAMEKEHH
ncbi:MAG: F0F1 ATP synthase subunit A [Bacteroidetes bacterium]|nr:F0F1 ATP synthase subunit A [Bacteroidota bacterium]MCL1968464.1 F0F1 ATP synthase subunit A [Bacteroidota bacterium]